ncbi:SpoIIAA family protein [Zobellella maritima]|uniref:STAS/SEC14 domain-containing protein n=1 Tax=Zobellella maritima TaxID=2059725 RepID=UPI000E305407|nr:STAS/SEC14 domain-containing protein [Zobellella maritima]
MFNIVENGANRLDIEFSGKLNSDEMKAALDALVEKTGGVEHGRMLYRIGDFDWPTLGAIGVELSRIPALFRMIRRFDKVAVVAEQDWVRTVSQWEGALIPGLEIKAFEPDQTQQAEAWLAE